MRASSYFEKTYQADETNLPSAVSARSARSARFAWDDDIGMDFEEEPADLLEDSAARADSSKRNREDEPKYD